MKTILLVLVAGLAVLALNFCSSAEAAPKYIATLATPNSVDSGVFSSNVGCVGNVNQTIQLQGRARAGDAPYCVHTSSTAATCIANCAQDFAPVESQLTYNDAGSGGTVTQLLTSEPIPMGLDKCACIGALDGGPAVRRMYRLDPNQ